MATTAKFLFNPTDTSTSTAIITVSLAIGVFYGVAKKKPTMVTIGYGLLFGAAGVIISLVSNNIFDAKQQQQA